MKVRVTGGIDARSCTGEKTAMTGSFTSFAFPYNFRAGWQHPSRALRPLFSLTTMSEYDFRPGGSLKLKGGVAEGGVVKKYA